MSSLITGQSLKRSNNHWLEQPKVFLCHSGAQKDFSHQLWVDILAQLRYAFIDIESIPRAKSFAGVIFNAAEECRVAVLVLSEEFFSRSVWPMLELQTFLRAKRSGRNPHLEILPLFFKISIEDIENPENERRWLSIWQKWAESDDRVNIKEYKEALRILTSYNGLVFQQGMGEVEYRRMIVEAICQLVPPCFTADLTFVQGAERICQEMINKINQLPLKGTRLASDTRILAVYGGPGLGKSTLCKILCNYFRKQVGWRVCHIEGGGALDLLDLQKLALKHLTGAPQSLLEAITNSYEGHDLLVKQIKGKRVFLAINNVCATKSSFDNTRMFLRLGLAKESLVLVTACTHEVLLEMIGHDISGQCFHLPNLTEEEAINIILDRAIPNCSFTSLSGFHQQIIRHCTSLCKINCVIQSSSALSEGKMVKYHYHPSSLIKMGAVLGGNSNIWVYKLKLWPKISELDNVNIIKYPFNKGQHHVLEEFKLPPCADYLCEDSVLTVYGGWNVPGKQLKPPDSLSGIQWNSEGWRNLLPMKEGFLSLNPFNRKVNNSHKQNPEAGAPSLNAYPRSSSGFCKYILRNWQHIKKIK